VSYVRFLFLIEQCRTEIDHSIQVVELIVAEGECTLNDGRTRGLHLTFG